MNYVKASYMTAVKGNSLCFEPDGNGLEFDTHGSLSTYMDEDSINRHAVGSVLYSPTHRLEEVEVEGEPEPFAVGQIVKDEKDRRYRIVSVDSGINGFPIVAVGLWSYRDAFVFSASGYYYYGLGCERQLVRPRKTTKVKKWVPIYSPPDGSQDTEF